MPRCHVASWRYSSGALGALVHTALLQGSKYEAELEILGDGLRIRALNPYSDCPSLRILRGDNDEEEVGTMYVVRCSHS